MRRTSSLHSRAKTALATAGLSGFVQAGQHVRAANAQDDLEFEAGNIRLRFTSDRGEDFVDIAPAREPLEYFMFDDLDLAMGWRTVADVLAKRQPEALESILARLSQNLFSVDQLFAPAQVRSTLAKLKGAAHLRGKALEDSLR